MIDEAHRSSRPDAGFTLLEVLVALTVLAISLATLFDIFSGTIRRQSGLQDERAAILLVQSKLDEVGVTLPIADGVTEGAFENGFGWRLQIEAYPAAPASLAAAKLATLTVFWPRPTGPRSLSVKTIKVVGRE